MPATSESGLTLGRDDVLDLAEFTGAQDRIGLSSRARKDQERNKRAGIVDMLEEAQLDDDDIEMRRWEDAQIRRSGHASHQTVDIPSKISAKSVSLLSLCSARLTEHAQYPVPQLSQPSISSILV